MKSILRIGALSLWPAIAGCQLSSGANHQHARRHKKSAAVKKDSAVKKKTAHPFHGNLAAVDKTAKTIKVGESIYQITSETKIIKDGKPATLDDGVVGEPRQRLCQADRRRQNGRDESALWASPRKRAPEEEQQGRADVARSRSHRHRISRVRPRRPALLSLQPSALLAERVFVDSAFARSAGPVFVHLRHQLVLLLAPLPCCAAWV